MTKNFAAVTVMLASLMPFAGAASELKPIQGGTFVIGDQSASIYYTVNGETFEVVTTMAPADGSGGPVRFVGYLQPGQKQIVSVGGYEVTTPLRELVLTHKGDVLTVVEMPETLASQ